MICLKKFKVSFSSKIANLRHCWKTFFWVQLKEVKINVFWASQSQSWKTSLYNTKKWKKLPFKKSGKRCFEKLRSWATGVDFFLGSTKRWAVEGSLCWLNSEMKNTCLNYDKSEKITFEILIRVNKVKINYFELHARDIVSIFFWALSKVAQQGVFQVGQTSK